MPRAILVVMENEIVCDQALDFAAELAQRLKVEADLLMIVEPTRVTGDRPERERRAKQALDRLASRFVERGVAAQATLRLGQPRRELLRFLAQRPPFQALIWGSGQELAGGRRGHWLEKTAGLLECPLWTVASRDDDSEGRGS